MSKNKTDIIKAKCKNNRGITLIEICIALIVIGLLMTPMLLLYETEMKIRQANNMSGSFVRITDALSKYVNRFGRYPRPASLLIAQDDDDINFGQEGPIAPANCPDMTVDGMCITTGSDPVYIGAVPFNELQLEFDTTLDPWSNKIIYAVTAAQTDAATYARDGNGRIKLQALNSYTKAVIDLDAIPPYGPSYTDMDMFLFSTGPAGKGGYNAEGNLIEACIDPGNLENEDENCDFDETFMLEANLRTDSRVGPGDPNDTHNINDNGTRSLSPGPGYYDDYTYETKAISRGDWNENEVLTDYVETLANRIGIKQESPNAALHVAGDVRIASGALQVIEACDSAGAGSIFNPLDCFNPSIIAATAIAPDMGCLDRKGPGSGLEAMISIGDQSVGCAAASNSLGKTTDPALPSSTDGFDLSSVTSNASCPSGVKSIQLNSGKIEITCHP